jgi:hypothetical protein
MEPLPKDGQLAACNAQIEPRIEFPYLQRAIQHHINTQIHAAFEFEQQHTPYSNQQFAAFLLAHTEGFNRDEPEESVGGKANFLILESTGNNQKEYRRISTYEVRRPHWAMEQIDPATASKEARKLGEFSGSVWEEFSKRFLDMVLDYRAWMEIAKRRPKRTTIRVV